MQLQPEPLLLLQLRSEVARQILAATEQVMQSGAESLREAYRAFGAGSPHYEQTRVLGDAVLLLALSLRALLDDGEASALGRLLADMDAQPATCSEHAGPANQQGGAP